ncbi:hypothetical protein GCM10010988_26900 [Cnuibacter physcomitrellae]|uniref:esterase/lipase family protein n=1 Tax=Cnuibacter physcomitrellae TaxID=1619308 RepID=UPI0019C2E322|nr:alpha/beta hydrolase [Cnuibacter physcomitrellae]GGI40001.1 hypothetical protein GCM10010988_26900 [Cnuibacter physcomitrellae]
MPGAGPAGRRRGANRLLRIPGWWIADYAYAAHWQVRAFFSRLDPIELTTGHLRPVVVLPGVYETWRFLQPLAQALHDRGHPVHVVEALGSNRRPVAEAAAEVADYLEEHDLEDVVLAAHSKGGLVGKYAMTLGGSARRIRSMVAVASPFAGSLYARWLPLPTLSIFSPRDPTILALARERSVDERIVSVFGAFDPHIPEGSRLPGAKNVELDTGGHFRVLADPRVIGELVALSE